MKKQIPIDLLKPGMYLVDIDQPWYKTPFLRNKFRIKNEEQILQLKQCGVCVVDIDPTRGLSLDVPQPPEDAVLEKNGLQPSSIQNGSPVPKNGSVSTNGEKPEAPSPHETSSHYLKVPTSEPNKAKSPPASSSEAISGTVDDQQDSLPPPILQGPIPPNGLSQGELEKGKTLFEETSRAVENVFAGVSASGRINAAEAKNVVNTIMHQILESSTLMVHQVQVHALRQFDMNLFIHVLNVCSLSLVLGSKAGFDSEKLQDLGLGALLHDIGHLRVPRNLQRKKGGYSKQEQKIIEKHPELGAALLAQTADCSPEARRIVAEHHERINGSGYPHGLSQHLISGCTRIVSVVDHYDSMVNGRRGHPPVLPAQAVRDLYKLGHNQTLDATWVGQFINLIGIYPMGSFVKFNTGERGIVVAENPLAKTKPIVTIIADPIQRAHFLVDLSLPNAVPSREITTILDPAAEGVKLEDYLTF